MGWDGREGGRLDDQPQVQDQGDRTLLYGGGVLVMTWGVEG